MTDPTSRILLTVSVAIISALAGLGGVLLGAFLTSRRERIQRRLNFIEKQLDRFYSPMLGLRTEIETATRFRKIVGDHADAAWRELTRDAREVSQNRLMS